MKKRTLIQAAAVALTSIAWAGPALAQDFPPAKPVTLVVGFAPRGAADAAARLIAKKLAENIGQSVVVENKGGAGGNIAHQQVAAGASDGTVLLFGSVGPLTIAPHLMKLPYDPFKDLAPISGGVYSTASDRAKPAPRRLLAWLALRAKPSALILSPASAARLRRCGSSPAARAGRPGNPRRTAAPAGCGGARCSCAAPRG